MRASAQVVIAAGSILSVVSSVYAQVDDSTPPPLNAITIIGTWEALAEEPLPTMLLHLEINKEGGPSYLVVNVVGSPLFRVYQLVSSELKDEHFKLTFRDAAAKKEPAEVVFLEGSGHGTSTQGAFTAKWWSEASGPPTQNNVFFVKGAWTRHVADASHTAERIIVGMPNAPPPPLKTSVPDEF